MPKNAATTVTIEELFLSLEEDTTLLIKRMDVVEHGETSEGEKADHSPTTRLNLIEPCLAALEKRLAVLERAIKNP